MKNATPQDDLMMLAFHVGRQMRHAMQQEGLKDHDHNDKVSPYQVFALFVLMDSANTMSDIAEEMNISLPSATALVDRLVKNGWVEREVDPKDRRVTRLTVTAEGRKVGKTMQEKRRKAFKFLIEAMPDDDVAALHRILTNLHATLEARQKQNQK